MTPDDARFLTLTAEAAQSVIDELELCASCGVATLLVDDDGRCTECRGKADAEELARAREEERNAQMSFGEMYAAMTRGGR